jgi:sigma-E factor negative regulatory protein RseC
MLEETGTVVAIEPDALWVETIQQSTCDSCVARKGCGQRVLSKLVGSPSRIRVLLDGRCPGRYSLNQTVNIGIPESVVVYGSLGVYLLPLVAMLAATVMADMAGAGEGATLFAAAIGLISGGGLVRLMSRRARWNPRFHPVLLDSETISIVEDNQRESF